MTAPPFAAAALIAVLALTGCAAGEPGPSWAPQPADRLSAADLAALAGVPALAASAVGVTETEFVDCWVPSEHPVDPADTVLGSDVLSPELTGTPRAASEAAFRILCRVGFTEAGENRWRDAICVGEPARTPSVDGCYMWAYYDGTPGFEDAPATRLPPP